MMLPEFHPNRGHIHGLELPFGPIHQFPAALNPFILPEAAGFTQEIKDMRKVFLQHVAIQHQHARG